jgi:hypothetical protein
VKIENDVGLERLKSNFTLVDKIQGYAVIASPWMLLSISNNEVQDFCPQYPDFLEYVVLPNPSGLTDQLQ